MTKRVTIFIDYQNVYKRARGIFELDNLENVVGQISPIKVGHLLVNKIGGDCSLEQVRAYRGIPSNNVNPKGYGAVRRQTASWKKAGQTETVLRQIHYPSGWPDSAPEDGKPREKGIDVALAIDFVRMAIAGDFDFGVIFSMDNDLKPALEYIGEAYPSIGLAVASWWPSGQVSDRARPSTISVHGINLKDIRLSFRDFESVRDDVDYSH